MHGTKDTIHGPIIEETAAISLLDTLFCFNTGATSHISPFKSDFIKFTSIEPKEIHGVHGASIPALGIGVIKIQCGKGRKFTLNYALYALQAALCLISVGRLGDKGCRIVFKVTHCWVLRNNKTLAKGIRWGKNLYHLQCDTPTFEHASIARAVPTLETWHRRLGHVNYASII